MGDDVALHPMARMPGLLTQPATACGGWLCLIPPSSAGLQITGEEFCRAIRSGDVSPSQATFATAVDLHHLIDAIGEASAQGRQVTL